jgi:hypothetical protein
LNSLVPLSERTREQHARLKRHQAAHSVVTLIDTMEIPQTREAAQEHIAKIRTEKGLEGPECNSSDLEAALVK